MRDSPVVLHASCVSWLGRGVLLMGAAGSGKSSIAMHLIGQGCDLVADDRTQLHLADNELIATCPPAIRGKIEARGMGILTLPCVPKARVICAVQLDALETNRYPPRRDITLEGIQLRLFHNPETGSFPDAIMQYLKHGTLTPT